MPATTKQVSYAQLIKEIEAPVTFQVGLLAKDGVVLASDQLVTKISPAPQKVRTTSLSDKIEVLADYGLCYCCTGDNFTVEVAKHIVAALELEKDKEENYRERLIRTAQDAVVIQAKRLTREIGSVNGDILLARRTPVGTFELWQIGLFPPTAGIATRIQDKTTQGDFGNLAQFFIERYYPKVPASLSVKQLLPLAAHTVLMASTMNPYVRGLEIAICTGSELRKLTEEELSPLFQASLKLDNQTNSLLIPAD